MPEHPALKRRVVRGLLALWVILVLAHTLVVAWRRRAGESTAIDDGAARLEIPAQDERGPLLGQRTRIAFDAYGAPTSGRPPIVLLHGLPGSRGNFALLSAGLAARGEHVLAFDLPGFGAADPHPPRQSILAHARTVLAALDRLRIERFFAVGWSQGGGVALHLGELAPERVAGVVLLASIGVQAGEGSGCYEFEHLKYALGRVLLDAADFLVPHFGRLEPGFAAARSSLRSFWQSDQRPLARLLDGLATPLLVVHGARDFLVPLSVARDAHRRVEASRLVVLEASHFLPFAAPFGQVEQVLEELLPFFQRHAAPGAIEPRSERDDTLAGPMQWLPFRVQRALPWWGWCALIALAAILWPRATPLVLGALTALAQLDLGLAALPLLLGLALGVARAQLPTSIGARCLGSARSVLYFCAAFAAVLGLRALL